MLLKAAFAAASAIVLLGSQQEPSVAQVEIPSAVESAQIASVDAITDQIRSTKVAAKDAVISFNFTQPISGIYLEWEQLPEQWQVQVDGKTVDGQQGFLHGYLSFDASVTHIQMTWVGQAELCDVYFLTAGQLPDWVQAWQPPTEQADFLLFPTHADDEHLWFGGVMPFYAGEKKMDVQVAYMVNHDTEPYRRHEQLDGLWTVGVRNYPIIPQFPDIYSESLEHARTIYDQQAIISYQVEQIRRFKPSVIVGQDINGEYGHGAHCLNVDSLMQAVELAADGTANPESLHYGVWDTPKTYLHLYPENQIVMDWNQPLQAFGGKTAFEMAQQGYACHVSQSQYWFAVKQSGSYDCRRFGLWRTTVGVDTQPDMLQNLPTPTPQPTPSPTPAPTPQPTPTESPVPNTQFDTQLSLHPLAVVGIAALLTAGVVIGYSKWKRNEKK